MSSVEEAIQCIEEGMKKISIGLQQLKQASFKDIVKEKQLENFVLDEEKADDMNRREIREHYEGTFDKYEEIVLRLENEKKQLNKFFQNAENTKKQLEVTLNTKNSIIDAFDININNIKIVMNDVIDNINPYASKADKKEKLPVQPNEHVDPNLYVPKRQQKPEHQPTEEELNQLGDDIYDYIDSLGKYDEEETGKITGVLLESYEYKVLKDKLNNKVDLKKIVEGVNEQLKDQKE